jgi:hypothetical protein
MQLRKLGLRVDGLGKCLFSVGPGGQGIEYSGNTPVDLIVKQRAITKYKFYLAFENQGIF